MSAENETVSLEEITPVVAPSKRSSAAKKAVPAKSKPAPKQPEIDLETIKAQIRAEIEKEIEGRIRKEMLASQEVVEEVVPIDVGETPPIHVNAAENEVVIHFVDDGFTFGGAVYYRGQELSLNPLDHPWVNMPRTRQIQKWGKQLFAKGAWPYGGFNLNDPELSDEDKARLLTLPTND
jgi:hypothetical protein